MPGTFTDTVDFGGGPLTSAGGYDISLAKFDPHGNHIWSSRFGDIDQQQATTATVDQVGNVLVTGYFQGTVDFGAGPLISAGGFDIFLAKFDPNGNHLWSKRFGDSSTQKAFGGATDPSGNVLITGYFRDTVDFGGSLFFSAGSSDVFLAKFAP